MIFLKNDRLIFTNSIIREYINLNTKPNKNILKFINYTEKNQLNSKFAAIYSKFGPLKHSEFF